MSHKKLVALLWTATPMFLGGFFALLVPMETGMNTLKEALQTLQLYPNCVSTLPDKNKKYIKQHIFKSVVKVFYYSTARMSP